MVSLKRAKEIYAEKYGEEEPKTLGQYYLQTLKDLGTGIKTGFGNTWGGIQQLFGGDKERLAAEYANRMQDYARASERSPWSAGGGNIIGAALSTPIPGLGQAKLAGALLSKSPVAAKLFGQGLTGATEGAIGSGLQYVDEGQSRGENIGLGALTGAGFAGALGSMPAVYQKLKPSSLVDTDIKFGDLIANLEAAQGTETNLGRVLGNKFLSDFYENYLTSLPFSGAAAASQRTASDITNSANELFKHLAGGSGNASAEDLLGGLRDSYFKLSDIKNKKYEQVNELADAYGVVPGINNFNKAADYYLDLINKDKFLREGSDRSVIGDLEYYAQPLKKKYKDYSGPQGAENLTFQGADILRSALKEKSDDFYKQGGKFYGKIYSDLKKSRDLDIDEAVSNYPDLAKMRENAHAFYAENIAPFNVKPLQKFISDKDADSDVLTSTFFKPSRGGKERANRLKLLTNAIEKSPNSQELMGHLRHEIFSPAIDPQSNMIDPQKMASIFQGIGPRQRKLLFDGERPLVSELENIKRATELNKDALNLMFNPHTGKRELPWKTLGSILAASGAGFAAAGPLGALGAGAMASGLGPAQWTTKFLTSEKSRDKIVDSILKAQTKKTNGNSKKMKAYDELSRLLSRGMATKHQGVEEDEY